PGTGQSPGPGTGAPEPGTGPVENLVVAGRDTVRQVTEPLPPVPRAVQQPVEQLLDTAQGAAGTLDGVAGPLLPTLP
ncbi:MAG: hypothetical protein ACRDK0_15380, partial [Solirubrobacteraceae bacterium]